MIKMAPDNDDHKIITINIKFREHFQNLVLTWFSRNGRSFPWRNTLDPYQIFLAEVLLRRTQAERIIEPYCGLIIKYPTLESLSKADIKELHKWFKPLGLFNRAELLIKAGKKLVNSYQGKIPNDLDKLLDVPGMGIYSARAVLCLAFNEPLPMIDESSGRLLQRVIGLEHSGPAYSDYKLIKIAKGLIPIENARSFNLGLLDIAYFFCKARKTLCVQCPINKICKYYASLPRS